MKQADRDIIALLNQIRDAGAAAETDPLALHSIPVGKTVFVDSVNGNNATAVRGDASKPFLTIAAAVLAMQANDRLVIGAGFTVNSASHAFQPETIPGSAHGSIIQIGAGDGYYNGGDYGWEILSDIISSEAGFALWGPCRVIANRINCTAGPAIQWPPNETTLDTHVSANLITGAKIAEPSANSWVDLGEEGASLAGAVYIKANQLISTSASNTAVDWPSGTNNVLDGDELPVATADRVFWVDALLIKSAGAVAGIYSPQSDGTKLYITAQKALGAGALAAIAVQAGKLWSNIDKLTSSHIFLSLTGGESWHDIRNLEVGTTAAQFAINCTGGTHVIKNARFIGGASNKGVNITGGTLILENCHINTSANATTNPITKSGGTLILKNCSLVAEGTRDSIAAADAQNVKVYGTSVANKAKHANVTIQVGTLTVSADVT